MFNFSIEKKSGKTLHDQLVDGLREHALTMKPGSKFPSETALCRYFKTSRVTVGNALNQLAREEYLERVQGSGTFVSDKMRKTVFFLFPFDMRIKNKSSLSYNTKLFFALQERLNNYGINLEILHASLDNLSNRLNIELFRRLPIGATVIVYSLWYEQLFSIFKERELQVIFLSMQNERDMIFDTFYKKWQIIEFDRKKTTSDFIEKCVSANRKKIIFLHNSAHWLNPVFSGYREGLKKYGAEFTPELTCYYGNEIDSNQRRLCTILQLREYYNFDALLANSYNIIDELKDSSFFAKVFAEDPNFMLGVIDHLNEDIKLDFPYYSIVDPQEQIIEKIINFLTKKSFYPDKCTITSKWVFNNYKII